ncbi:MAG TPA: SpoIID/LytB domain-containing protein [Terriglobia bacterium]|nr:SpoIID/LytB domain-containing protein [Terriglobia bacterium]
MHRTRKFATLLAFLLIFGSLLYSPATEQAALSIPDTVRVRLFSTLQPTEVRVTIPGGESILINTQTPQPIRTNGPVTIQVRGSQPIHLDYPLEITTDHGLLFIINEIPFEEYVAAVLAGEASNFQSDESLKAMAVAVRSYAVHFLDRHQKEAFNFCDTTHCQDFRITAVTARLRQAANETHGQVLLYDGQPIMAYYHKDCGGITEARSPYLPQLSDRFCVSSGRKPWTAEVTAADLKSVFGIGNPSGIEVLDRSSSGRVQRLRITGSETRTVAAETFRLDIGRKLGWDKIRSDLYEVMRPADASCSKAAAKATASAYARTVRG